MTENSKGTTISSAKGNVYYFLLCTILMLLFAWLVYLLMPSYALGDGVLSVPNNVYEISPEAFAECNSVSIVHIPNSVRKILDKAFWKCKNLAEVTILDNVEYIAADAFGECPNLKLKVFYDTYAFRYAIRNNIPY